MPFNLLKHYFSNIYVASSLFLLVWLAFFRLYNLNYNSPFNDEAVYIVVGDLGLFGGDWVSYNPGSWIAGHPRTYTSIAALGYKVGGIVGARFISAILGLIPVVISGLIVFEMTAQKSRFVRLAALIMVMTLVGASTSGIYVSRLATYDSPSIALLMVSVLAIFKIRNIGVGLEASRWYILASLTLALSVWMKIIMLAYVPLLGIYTLILAWKNSTFRFWIFYFAVPLSVLLALYLVSYWTPVSVYLSGQASREQFGVYEVWNYFIDNSDFLTGFWVFGLVSLLVTRKWSTLLLWGVAGIWIIGLHVFTHRIASFDKHSYISVIFWSIAATVGIAEVISRLYNQKAMPFVCGVLIGVSALFGFLSYENSQRYNSIWPNVDGILSVLIERMEEDDRVLTQIGGATILAVSDVTHPTHTTTFDWFEYESKQGVDAYEQAVIDGYFKWIVLDSKPYENNRLVYEVVVNNIHENYVLAKTVDQFKLYERAF